MLEGGGRGGERGRKKALQARATPPPQKKKPLRKLKGLSPRMKEQSHLAVVEETLPGGLPARWEGN